ncbi:hypothetical protein DRH13_01095, partial [Candidatus Woesebacteria bacterium]
MNKLLLGKYEKGFHRFLEILPGSLAWSIILAPAIGGLIAPNIVAYGILAFLAYWLYKSFKSAYYSFKGYFILKDWETVSWPRKWKKEKTTNSLDWDDIRHVVVIPNY